MIDIITVKKGIYNMFYLHKINIQLLTEVCILFSLLIIFDVTQRPQNLYEYECVNL